MKKFLVNCSIKTSFVGFLIPVYSNDKPLSMFQVENNTQRVQVSGSTNFTYNRTFLIITNFYLIVHVLKDLNPYRIEVLRFNHEDFDVARPLSNPIHLVSQV